jgi:hypothetical protein
MKWVEAKPITNISSTSIKKFFWQNIICDYGVPQHITVDNAKYFDSAMLKDFCHQIRTKAAFTTVYHPQSNWAVERANALIFEAIKKLLEREIKRQMGRSYAKGSMESQYDSLQGNKLYTISVVARSRRSTIRRDEAPKLTNINGGSTLPHRS